MTKMATIIDVAKRAFPVLVALILMGVGWWAGGKFAVDFIVDLLGPEKCEDRLAAGGPGLYATLLSIVASTASALFLRIGKLYQFVKDGDTKKYHWFFDGAMLAVAAFAVSGLLSFSWGAVTLECPPPPPLPICTSTFEVCQKQQTESECRLCNLQEEMGAARKAIDRLQLERIGAFPLLFENAGTNGDKLSQRGVQLAPDQLATWHRKLFGDTPWPVAAAQDVAYCVVGFSSKAPFIGREDSNELNVEAAQCRADGVAAELPSVLDQAAPQIASCRWCSYDAMARPRLRSGEHLATSDKHLISRSVFVHGFRVTPEDGFDVGAACPKLVAQKLGLEGDGRSCMSCSTFDGGDGDDNQCPLEERDGLVG